MMHPASFIAIFLTLCFIIPSDIHSWIPRSESDLLKGRQILSNKSVSSCLLKCLLLEENFAACREQSFSCKRTLPFGKDLYNRKPKWKLQELFPFIRNGCQKICPWGCLFCFYWWNFTSAAVLILVMKCKVIFCIQHSFLHLFNLL